MTVEHHPGLQGQGKLALSRYHSGVKCAATQATKIDTHVQNDMKQAVLIAGAGLAGVYVGSIE